MKNLFLEVQTFQANITVLDQKINNYHWFIKGPEFFEIHTQMDAYHAQMQATIDEVAELLLAHNQTPVSNLKAVLELSTFKELTAGPKNAATVLDGLVEDFTALLNHSIAIIKLADEVDEFIVVDQFTSLAASYKKTLWMLSSMK